MAPSPLLIEEINFPAHLVIEYIIDIRTRSQVKIDCIFQLPPDICLRVGQKRLHDTVVNHIILRGIAVEPELKKHTSGFEREYIVRGHP